LARPSWKIQNPYRLAEGGKPTLPLFELFRLQLIYDRIQISATVT
jgi:hypothetical protein